MLIFSIIFFIVVVIGFAMLFYKYVCLNDELNDLYEQIYYYIDRDFGIGGKHDD